MEGDESGVKGVKGVKWREINLELKELKELKGVKTNVLWAVFMLISHIKNNFKSCHLELFFKPF